VQDSRYKENFSYDWNGNIITVDRYSGDVVSGVAKKMDELTYNYGTNSNLLTHIDDAFTNNCSATGGYDDDLDGQGGGNYDYDKVGALTQDVSERITDIEWNPYGKMKAVHKDQTNNTNACMSTEYADADVEYLYTASQQRLCKIVKPHQLAGLGLKDQSEWTYYWYAYDAGGQLMAVYKQTYDDHSLPAGDYHVNFDVQEHDVYGSGRLGIRKGDDDGKYQMTFTGVKTGGVFSSLLYSGGSSALSRIHYSRELGNKQYEIANHLGNVLVTVSDKRLGYMATPVALGVVDWYTADVLSYSDYYVFGAAQPGRTGGDNYRYGFNGKENDPEVEANAIQDYGMWMYDPRVGRFFSTDPLMYDYPYYTPYQFTGDNPITYVDLDGCERVTANGNPLFSDEYVVTDGNESWIYNANGRVCDDKPQSTSPNGTQDPIAKKIDIQGVTITDKYVGPKTEEEKESSYEQFAKGTTDGQRDAVLAFTDHPIDVTVAGVKGSANFIGDMFVEWWDYWAHPKPMWRRMIDGPVTPSGRAMVNATAYERGHFWGGVAISSAAGAYFGSFIPVNGRYFPTCTPEAQGLLTEGEFTTIWRSVSEGERADIAEFGVRNKPGAEASYETGKLFAPTAEEACAFGKNNYFHYDQIPNYLMEIKVPNAIMKRALYFETDAMNAISIPQEYLHLLEAKPLNYNPLIRK
jgi:RHS repeat-associated protein